MNENEKNISLRNDRPYILVRSIFVFKGRFSRRSNIEMNPFDISRVLEKANPN